MLHRKIDKQMTLKSGFSLIEIMAVLVIIGLVMGIAINRGLAALRTGRENSTRANLKATASAIDMYHMIIGNYPKQLEDLVEKPKGPEGAKWKEKFLDKIKQDAWSHDFYYKVTPKDKHPYELYSYGPSGPDAADASEHIIVWDI